MEKSFIKVNRLGKLVIESFYSDMAVEVSLEQLFIMFLK